MFRLTSALTAAAIVACLGSASLAQAPQPTEPSAAPSLTPAPAPATPAARPTSEDRRQDKKAAREERKAQKREQKKAAREQRKAARPACREQAKQRGLKGPALQDFMKRCTAG